MLTLGDGAVPAPESTAELPKGTTLGDVLCAGHVHAQHKSKNKREKQGYDENEDRSSCNSGENQGDEPHDHSDPEDGAEV